MHFWGTVFPLLGFWGEFLCGEVVSPMPILQPGGPGYLSGISLKTCLVWVALLSARLLPGWILGSLVHTGSITWLNMPSAWWMYDWAGRQNLLYKKQFLFVQFHIEIGFCVSLLQYECYIHVVNQCGTAECGVSQGLLVPELSPYMTFLFQ